MLKILTPHQNHQTTFLALFIGISQNLLPSGKRLHNYGKSPFSMGQSTTNDHVQ